MKNPKAELERARIRQTIQALTAGKARQKDFQAVCEEIIRIVRQRKAGEDSDSATDQERHLRSSVDPDVYRTLILLIGEVAESRNKEYGSPKKQMERDLKSLSFGIRVLQLREQGFRQGEALRIAYDETGLPPISIAAIRKTYFMPFITMVNTKGFVPYWERDPETGALAPTRYVPADIKDHPGRNKKLKP